MLRRIKNDPCLVKSYQKIIVSCSNSLMDVSSVWQDRVDSHSKAGFPEHILKLKFGCPVVLIRNINAVRGLVNGTRMSVLNIRNDVNGMWLKCRILSGKHKNTEVEIPIVIFHHPPCEMVPVEFTRRQFPVRVCFSMTAMKAQGQTSNSKLGIYLPNDDFSHGQLYVPLSRCTNIDNVRFCLKGICCQETKY